MKVKFNLKSEEILLKRFNIELKGYDAKEVDYFLDLIKKDYETWDLVLRYHQELNARLNKDKDELTEKNRVLKNHLENLQIQIKELEIKGLGNVDIIKRINKLEEKGKKLNK